MSGRLVGDGRLRLTGRCDACPGWAMGGGKTSDVDFLSTNTVADGVAGRRLIPAVLEDLLLVANDAILAQEASIIAGMRMLLDNGRRRLSPLGRRFGRPWRGASSLPEPRPRLAPLGERRGLAAGVSRPGRPHPWVALR